MTEYYIFDMDGTLTPPRRKIDTEFSALFKEFCKHRKVIILTSADKNRTIEQLGEDVYNLAVRVYTCMGNELWIDNTLVRREEDFELPDYMLYWLTGKQKSSKFVLRTGKHLEYRTGVFNFSILGRNATLKERMLYRKWDQDTAERIQLVEDFNKCFSHSYIATIGGETGIDITLKNKDKSQIMKEFSKHDRLTFFGDETGKYGGDQQIADGIRERGGIVHAVSSWHDTARILSQVLEAA